MTVSRVVRGDQVVADSTVSKVQAAIKTLGYRSDPALSALSAYRSLSRRPDGSIFAFLEFEDTRFSRSVFAGAKSEAELLGYSLERHIFPSTSRFQAQLCRQLYHRGIRGLLVGPSKELREFTNWQWESFATVSLSAMLRQPATHAVTTDYFAGVTLAMQHLKGLGSRRIGFAVNAAHECRTSHRWLGGYLSSLDGRKPVVFSGKYNPDTVRDWIVSSRLDGILTIHQMVFTACPSSRITTIFLSELDCPPTVPCIVYDPRKIGVEGVRLIHNQCLRHDFGLPSEVKVMNLQPIMRLPGASDHSTDVYGNTD